MSPRLRMAERRAATRDALLDAATEVFACKGYQAATVAEIAAAAGFTVGAVYSNFPNKRALFTAVFERQASEQLALADLLDTPGGNLLDLARRLLDQDEHGRRSWLLSLEFITEAQRDPATALPLHDLEARVRGSIADILRRHIPQLEDDLTLATALQALWRGWLLGSVANEESSPQRFARSIEWLIAGSLRAGPEKDATAAAPGAQHPPRR